METHTWVYQALAVVRGDCLVAKEDTENKPGSRRGSMVAAAGGRGQLGTALMTAPSLAPGAGAGAAPAGGQQGKIITVPGIPGHFIQVSSIIY